MKLKAPEGVGNPCVAGVVIAPRDGIYEVEPEIGALLDRMLRFCRDRSAGKAERRKRAAACPAGSKKGLSGGLQKWPRPISQRSPM